MSTYEELGLCPGCEGAMPEYPALSRYDGKTRICGLCGLFEAMVDERGGRLDSPGFEDTSQDREGNAQG